MSHSTNYSIFYSFGRNAVGVMLAGLFIFNLGFPAQTNAGERIVRFSNHVKRIPTVRLKINRDHIRSRTTMFSRTYHQGNNHYATPRGPKVINVRKAIRRKRLKVIIHDSSANLSPLTPHVIDPYSRVPRSVYYDDSQCENGFECTLRLGNKAYSPKVIILGKKKPRSHAGPKIIYPPS